MSAAVAACGVGITGSPLRTVVGAEEIRSKREKYIYIYINRISGDVRKKRERCKRNGKMWMV